MNTIRSLACVALVCTAASANAQEFPPGDVPPPGQPAAPYCREFTQQVMIDGHRQVAYGTSCRQPDGSWRVARDPNTPLPPDLPPGAVPYTPEYAAVAPPVYYTPYYAPYYPEYYPGTFVGVGVGFGGYHGGYGGYRGGFRR